VTRQPLGEARERDGWVRAGGWRGEAATERMRERGPLLQNELRERGRWVRAGGWRGEAATERIEGEGAVATERIQGAGPLGSRWRLAWFELWVRMERTGGAGDVPTDPP
jgi:hypothetical protein